MATPSGSNSEISHKRALVLQLPEPGAPNLEPSYCFYKSKLKPRGTPSILNAWYARHHSSEELPPSKHDIGMSCPPSALVTDKQKEKTIEPNDNLQHARCLSKAPSTISSVSTPSQRAQARRRDSSLERSNSWAKSDQPTVDVGKLPSLARYLAPFFFYKGKKNEPRGSTRTLLKHNTSYAAHGPPSPSPSEALIKKKQKRRRDDQSDHSQTGTLFILPFRPWSSATSERRLALGTGPWRVVEWDSVSRGTTHGCPRRHPQRAGVSLLTTGVQCSVAERNRIGSSASDPILGSDPWSVSDTRRGIENSAPRGAAGRRASLEIQGRRASAKNKPSRITSHPRQTGTRPAHSWVLLSYISKVSSASFLCPSGPRALLPLCPSVPLPLQACRCTRHPAPSAPLPHLPLGPSAPRPSKDHHRTAHWVTSAVLTKGP